jgi:hypothetical protein
MGVKQKVIPKIKLWENKKRKSTICIKHFKVSGRKMNSDFSFFHAGERRKRDGSRLEKGKNEVK